MDTESRQFYKTLLKLAIPVTIQNTITSSLNLVDTVMIGQLGDIEIAAVGLANRYFFILMLLLFALSSGTSIFTAQFWGKKDTQRIGVVMAIALLPALGFAFVFSALGFLFPDAILGIFSNDPLVVASGSSYLHVVIWSYVFTAVSALHSFVLRSMEEVKLPMYSSIVALSVNTFLNYCLILGHFGFPAWGVKGAAVATLISRVIEMAILLIGCYRKKYPTVTVLDLWRISRVLTQQFFRTTWPVIIHEFSWVIGVTLYAVVYGRMGTSEIAAINIVSSVEQLSFGVFFGLANAAGTMIGNQIGAGREELASRYAVRFSVISPLGASGMGVLLILLSPLIVSFFHVSAEVQMMTLKILFVLGCVFSIKMFNLMSIVGILRAGGDTKYSMFLEMGTIWLVGVPLAFLGGFYWKMPVYWVFGLVCAEELAKMLLGIFRIRSKKWIHDLASVASGLPAGEQEKVAASS